MSGEGWFIALALRSLRSQSISSAVSLRSIAAISLFLSEIALPVVRPVVSLHEARGLSQPLCQTRESSVDQIVGAGHDLAGGAILSLRSDGPQRKKMLGR